MEKFWRIVVFVSFVICLAAAHSPLAGLPGRKYAYGQLNVLNTGANVSFTLFQPTVLPGDTSSVALWVTRGSGSSLLALEVGITVDPAKYNTNKPVVYVLWTKNGYTNQVYNVEANGYIPYLADGVPIGLGQPADTLFRVPITPYQSTKPATGYWASVVALSIKKVTANWVVFAGNIPIGFWNSTTLGLKSTDVFSSIQWGGEVYSSKGNTVQMGSGHVAAEKIGRACAAASQQYFDVTGSPVVPINSDDSWAYSTTVTGNACYTIESGRTLAATFRAPMYFGGPLLGSSPVC